MKFESRHVRVMVLIIESHAPGYKNKNFGGIEICWHVHSNFKFHGSHQVRVLALFV
jgi:hypothetical protein